MPSARCMTRSVHARQAAFLTGGHSAALSESHWGSGLSRSFLCSSTGDALALENAVTLNNDSRARTTVMTIALVAACAGVTAIAFFSLAAFYITASAMTVACYTVAYLVRRYRAPGPD